MHVGIAIPWLWGKRSRHSRRLRNPQFHVPRKRPIETEPLSLTSPVRTWKISINCWTLYTVSNHTVAGRRFEQCSHEKCRTVERTARTSVLEFLYTDIGRLCDCCKYTGEIDGVVVKFERSFWKQLRIYCAIEARLQCLQWIPRLSSWRPFCSVYMGTCWCVF